MPANRKRGDRYRFDVRSKKQFQQDIRESHKTENSILKLWLDRIEQATGKRPAYRDNGCGPDGRYLDRKQVSTDADYDVDDFGLIEVKFSKPALKKHFHLKVDQVKSYLKQDASILMVDAWETERPRYVLIPAALLRQMADELQQVSWIGFGGKLAYRLPLDKFVWRDLK